jgi:E3 ubiquitin-protein ligase UBR1
VEHETSAKFPSGSCILCQEETDNEKLYGTFAYISPSRMFRKTPSLGVWAEEIFETPQDLDRTLKDRPFGVARKNRRVIKKTLANGTVVELERQDLARGFPSDQLSESLVSTGCGHIMHITCFEVYLGAVRRRHSQQIARHHPENLSKAEFLCPLCKALGNAFLPIIWKPKTLNYPGPLTSSISLDDHCRKVLIEPTMATNSNGPHLYNRSYGEAEFISPLSTEVEPAFAEMCNPSDQPNSSASQEPTSPTYQFRIRDEDDSIVMGFNFLTGEEALSASLLTRQLVTQGQLGATGAITFPELHKVYSYLATGFGSNQLQLSEAIPSCLASTICSVEIAQRGIGTSVSLLDSISSQTLTHLRVLTETALSIKTVNVLTPISSSRSVSSPNQQSSSQSTSNSVFQHDASARDQWTEMYNPAQVLSSAARRNTSPFLKNDAKLPFLQQIPFNTFCVHSLASIPGFDMDVMCSMKLFYLAEIVRVVLWFARNRPLHSQLRESGINANLERPSEAFLYFINHLCSDWSMGSSIPANAEAALYHMVKVYSLQFLRRCIILMHIRYSVEFSYVPSEKPELDRLTELLQLPTISDLLGEVLKSPAALDILDQWTMHARGNPGFTVELDHPAIFELVGLPKNFDTLQDAAMRQRCPTTGRPMLDPSLCLFCGEITCSQSTCCNREVGGKRLGGCQQHRRRYVFPLLSPFIPS